MSRLGPYNQRQVNGNFVLTELQRKNIEIAQVSNELQILDNRIDTQVIRIDERIDLTASFSNDQIIFLDGKIDNETERLNNEVKRLDGRLLKKGFYPGNFINIVMTGDSWVEGSATYAGLADRLGLRLAKTVLKFGYGGRTITNLLTLEAFVNNIVKNPDYSEYSTLINYGVNDYRNSGSFYANAYQYQNCSLASYITCACPQDKIIDARDFEIKTGDARNNQNYNFGLRWNESATYVETTITSRYLAPVFFITKEIAENTIFNPEIIVDGEIVSGQRVNFFTIDTAQTRDYYTQCVLVDMGFVAERIVRIRCTNLVIATGLNFFLNYVCTWNGDELNMRNVLAISPPIIDFQTREDTDASFNDYQLVISAQKAAVRQAQNAGLKVFLHEPITSGELLVTDNLHLTERGADVFSDEIIRDSVNIF